MRIDDIVAGISVKRLRKRKEGNLLEWQSRKARQCKSRWNGVLIEGRGRTKRIRRHSR